jgi:hypothetical protein
MYLFSRTCRLAPGQFQKGLAWATGMTETVKKVSGLDIRLWANVHGPEAGRLVWAGFVEDLAKHEAAIDKLQADPGFPAKAESGAQFTVGGIDDALAQVIHGTPDPTRETKYVSSVRSVCATGNLVKGMTVGVEIAKRVEKITGAPTSFLVAVTGNYGAVGWTSGFESISVCEKAQQKLQSNPEWLAYLDKEAGSAYATDPAYTTTRLLRRIA